MVIGKVNFQDLHVESSSNRIVQRPRVGLESTGSPWKKSLKPSGAPNLRAGFGPIFDTHIYNLQNSVRAGRTMRVRRFQGEIRWYPLPGSRDSRERLLLSAHDAGQTLAKKQ